VNSWELLGQGPTYTLGHVQERYQKKARNKPARKITHYISVSYGGGGGN
jgi:hypothetical protein